MSRNPIDPVAGGATLFALIQSTLMDGIDIDGESGTVDQVNIFKIVAGGAIGSAPTNLMFSLGERQTFWGLQEIPIILATVDAFAARSSNHKRGEQEKMSEEPFHLFEVPLPE